MDITPNTVPEHGRLEHDVMAFLSEHGFLFGSATYHDVMDPLLVNRLQSVLTPTTLRLRTRADRVAVHRRHGLAFEWEAKTHAGSKYHNMALEVYPLCAHLAESDMDVRCLYVYRDQDRGYDVGFWVHNPLDIPVRAVKVPTRWQNHWFAAWIVAKVQEWWPEVPIDPINWRSGSGDPFILIDESVVREMSDWRDLILAVLPVESIA